MDGTSVDRLARPATGRPPATEPAGFAEVVFAEPAWVRAEFDAIVAANFGVGQELPRPSRPSPAPPVRGDRDGAAPAGGRPARGGRGGPVLITRRTGARERSPPPRTLGNDVDR